ncbi:magnesium transporter [Mariniplasma anaerobium]|uniref:Magnesium transporter MgtE n=1 Tax=Mariniplasma anaerobium TaxID=2735436 RepID=A0A7U9TIN1_9MOLU|nr:magnesium transporter [Mariniplasma anaerobium]BCR35522.1 magnesium transporter [Mariniplasma anaerobium]
MLKEILKLKRKDMIQKLDEIHGFDMAQSFLELKPEEKIKLYTVINNEKLADLVSYLEPDEAALILQDFDIIKQKQVIEEMEPDDAADIISELEEDNQEQLLNALEDSSEILSLIEYDEDETGSAMTTLLLTLNPLMDVKQATKKVIKEAPEVETISTLFVVDEANHFLGIVGLKKLLKAKLPLTVKDIMIDQPSVYDTDPITETISKIRNYAIYEIPVVNHDQELLGMVTLDDALDIYEDEAQEDFEKLSALPETIEQNAFKTAMHRIPWLLMLLIISIPISLVTSLFGEVLTAVAILIIFQPLISGSAGNVATQTLAVTLKMFAKNEEGVLKNSYREIVTGIINGFVIGLVAFGVTYLFTSMNQHLTDIPFKIAFIVGLSLWLTVLIAPIIAVSVPVTLKKLKLDPAVASGPFITTLIDLSAISLYFGLATILLGGV